MVVPIMDAGRKVLDARRGFARSSARGLKMLEEGLPALIMCNSASCAAANSQGGMRYVGTAIPFPQTSQSDYSFLESEVTSEEMGEDAEYCRICGSPLFNLCEGEEIYDFNGNYEGLEQHKNFGNARFCEKCGKPTTYFKLKFLVPFNEFQQTIDDDDVPVRVFKVCAVFHIALQRIDGHNGLIVIEERIVI